MSGRGGSTGSSPGVAAKLARAPEGAPPGGAGRVYAGGGLRTAEDVLTALGSGAHGHRHRGGDGTHDRA